MAKKHGTPAVAPLFITQQRPVRDFLDDQACLATIKSPFLYQLQMAQPAPIAVRARRVAPHSRSFSPTLGSDQFVSRVLGTVAV